MLFKTSFEKNFLLITHLPRLRYYIIYFHTNLTDRHKDLLHSVQEFFYQIWTQLLYDIVPTSLLLLCGRAFDRCPVPDITDTQYTVTTTVNQSYTCALTSYSPFKCLPSSSPRITWFYHVFRRPQVSFSCRVRSHRWLDGDHCVITVCKFQFFIQLFDVLVTDRVTAQRSLDLCYCLQRDKFQEDVRS